MRLFKVIGTQPSSLLFLCSAATEPWRAACVLEEAKHRSLSERLSIWWSTWPKDVLDLNYHTLLWHCQRHAMGVSHTVNTLTQSLHLGSHSRFIIRKKVYFTALQNIRCLSLNTVWQILLFRPTKPQHWQEHVFWSLHPSQVAENQNHLILMRDCVHNMLLKWSWPQKIEKRKNMFGTTANFVSHRHPHL